MVEQQEKGEKQCKVEGNTSGRLVDKVRFQNDLLFVVYFNFRTSTETYEVFRHIRK